MNIGFFYYLAIINNVDININSSLPSMNFLSVFLKPGNVLFLL